MLTSQKLHHVQFVLSIFRNACHFFHRNPWQCDFPHKIRKSVHTGTQKELIQLANVISRLANDHRQILSSSIKTIFCRLTISKIYKSKVFAFHKTLHFVSTKPSVPCAAASWSVLDFWCYSLQTKTKKH